MKLLNVLFFFLLSTQIIFSQDSAEELTALSIDDGNDDIALLTDEHLINKAIINYRMPDAIATIILNNKSEELSGNLIAAATAGLYSISYTGVITQSALDQSLLAFHVQYTDPDIGEIVTIPSIDIDNYNIIVSNPEDRNSISGNLIVYAAEGSPITYTVNYASNPAPDADAANAMKYSLRIVIEKL